MILFTPEIHSTGDGSLSGAMDFDHVIRVYEGGMIDAHPESAPYAPEMYGDTDEELSAYALGQGWEFATGYTGQYGYNGLCMHPSEFIGGALAEHILATPGYWVAVIVPGRADDPSDADSYDPEPAGWAVAHRPIDPANPEETETKA